MSSVKREGWLSRDFRKGFGEVRSFVNFGERLVNGLWLPQKLNWWIGVLFAIGSSLFILGSLFSLFPSMAFYLSVTEVNTVFFIGSIPFTIAAFLQLHQAAQAERKWVENNPGHHRKFIGWWSTLLQFLGTLLFNVNTWDGMHANWDWFQLDMGVWAPDMLGSIFFLISGYLAFIEVARGFWSWKISSISWWVVFINLLACLAFMVSACFAFVPAVSVHLEAGQYALLFTAIGGFGFLLGSLLMLPETAENK